MTRTGQHRSPLPGDAPEGLPPTAGHGRVAALDGLRGIAVLLVVLGHGLGAAWQLEDTPVARLFEVPFNGGVGVTVFFVLSGYLITSILVRERERTGRVSLRDFYLRRTFRILPAFYVFLAVVAVLAAVGAIRVGGSDLLASGLMVHNYWSAGDTWWLGHTWSLAVEEQFYLVWPLLLLWLRPRRACQFGVAYLLAAPVVRVASYVFVPDSQDQVWEMFHTRADSLLTGCLIALLPVAYPGVWARVRRWAGLRAAVPLAVVAVLVSSALEVTLGGLWSFPAGYTVTNLATAVVVVSITTAGARTTRTTRVLSWRPLTAVGLISYSLYLYQQVFLPEFGLTPSLAGSSGPWTALLGIAAALVAATMSYHLVEQPFLRLKNRFSRVGLPTGPRAARDETADPS